MGIIAVISGVVYVYTFYCIIREMRFNQYKQKVSILIYLIALLVIMLFWLYNRKGYTVGFTVEKVDFDFGLLLMIISQVSTSITRYFRKERTGEDLKLNYKHEIKRIYGTKTKKITQN